MGVGHCHLLLKRLSKMNRVKAHALRKFEEAKLVEELTLHRVSIETASQLAQARLSEWFLTSCDVLICRKNLPS